MNDTNGNNPAYPSKWDANNRGLTIRQAYAKDAPPVPEWFEERYKLKIPDRFNDWATDDIKRKYNDEGEIWEAMPTDKERMDVEAHHQRWEHYFEKEKELAEKIFFEWRWYYADMMLKTR
jgi:hypothetical protein